MIAIVLLGVLQVLSFIAILVFRALPLRLASRERVEQIHADASVTVAKLKYAKPGERPELTAVTLPDDLEAYCNDWRDQFARDDARSSLRQKFLELHTGDAEATWQSVRRSVGIGEIP